MPQQIDDYSCGVFSLAFMKMTLKNKISKEIDLIHYRKEIKKLILNEEVV